MNTTMPSTSTSTTTNITHKRPCYYYYSDLEEQQQLQLKQKENVAYILKTLDRLFQNAEQVLKHTNNKTLIVTLQNICVDVSEGIDEICCQLVAEDDVDPCHHQAVMCILEDISDSIRQLARDEEELEELTVLGLGVANMFVFVTRNVLSRLSTQALLDQHPQGGSFVVSSSTSLEQASSLGSSVYYEVEEEDDDAKTTIPSIHIDPPRQRLLWSPVYPIALEMLNELSNRAVDHPLLSIPLTATLWPTALIAAFIGTPLLTTDYILQHTYKQVQETSIVKGMEQGAAGVLQVGQLYYIFGKLMFKRSVRVLSKQVERRGGVKKVALEASGHLCYGLLHPIETAKHVKYAIDGVCENLNSFHRKTKSKAYCEEKEKTQMGTKLPINDALL